MDLTLSPPSAALEAFAEEVGGTDAGPVVAVGGRTQWRVGGTPDAGVREVRAPAGGIQHEPAELIVRCGAGTPIAELEAALAAHGQMCPLDATDPAATVGGVLAVGHSGLRRLRYGPVRDLVLEIRYVAADGVLVKAGAPVVKNVTGFDLCRLLVGSLGLIGFLGEVVLRCRPIPARSQWVTADGVDPWSVRRALFSPSAVLWDGESVWVLLEGYPDDLAAEQTMLEELGSFTVVGGPPNLPAGDRLSLPPADLRTIATGGVGRFLAEIGVGTVHVEQRPPELGAAPPPDADLQRAIKAAYDPSGRLNPGRWFW